MGASPKDVIGDVIGERYRLVEQIGSGGMGTVFRAERMDAAAGDGPAVVALKLIRPETLNDRSVARFAREAAHAAQVRHPHVVEVCDSGVTKNGEPWLAMELLVGQSLEDRLVELPPPTVSELVTWIEEALDGLAAVHDLGILHRDLKPANLYLAERDGKTIVKVLDFGLSRSVGQAPHGSPIPSLTQTHQFLGTPYYASPEQVRSAKRIDHRADLFSMGVILYEALAGRRPFDGPSAAAVIAAVVADDPVSLGELRPDLPAPLVAVVHRALARDPNQRFSDARALARDLRDAVATATADVASLRATPRVVSSRPPVVRPPDRTTQSLAPKTLTTMPTSSSGSGWLGLTAVLIGLAAAGLVALLALGTSTDDASDDGPGPLTAMGAPAPVTPISAMPHRVAGPLSLSSLAMRFRALPAGSGRGDVRFVRDGVGYSVVTMPGVAPSTVRTLAARLGGEPVPFTAPLDGVLQPEILRTTVSLNVRQSPRAGGALVRTLPRGTIVVGFSGRVDAVDSRRAGTGSWMWIAVTEADAGFSSAQFLEPDTGCVPEFRSVLEPLPAPRRPALSNDTVVGRVAMWQDGQRFDALWTVARDPDERVSHVLVHRTGSGCALDLVSRQTIEGFVVDTLFTETEESGGDSLYVVAWRASLAPDPRGEETWTAFRVGHEEVVYEVTLQSSQELPRGRRATLGTRVTNGPDGTTGFFPLRIRHADGRREVLAWTGERLEPLPDPAFDPASGSTELGPPR